MIENVKNFFYLLFTEKQEYLWIGVCMVSAIIVAIGILKYLFKLDNIKCDWLRSITLSALSVIACFVSTAIMFWSKGISFEYYLISSSIISAVTTLVYHTYAKWGLKNFVHFIGGKTLGKLFGASSAKDIDELKVAISNIPSEVKASYESKKKKTAPTDNELKNL